MGAVEADGAAIALDEFGCAARAGSATSTLVGEVGNGKVGEVGNASRGFLARSIF
jgi:hypothetical protein